MGSNIVNHVFDTIPVAPFQPLLWAITFTPASSSDHKHVECLTFTPWSDQQWDSSLVAVSRLTGGVILLHLKVKVFVDEHDDTNLGNQRVWFNFSRTQEVIMSVLLLYYWWWMNRRCQCCRGGRGSNDDSECLTAWCPLTHVRLNTYRKAVGRTLLSGDL